MIKRAVLIKEIRTTLETTPLEIGAGGIAEAVVDRLEALGIVGVTAEPVPLQAPDLAKELTAWLDANVMRCEHGTVYVTCGPCMAAWLPR